MGALTFTVDGIVPWARSGQRGRAHYTQPKVKQHQRKIALAAKAAGAVPVEGPVSVRLVFDYDTDTTTIVIEDGDGKATRPDVDNLAKLCLDALNGIAWRDDGQVSVLVAIKTAKKKGKHA